jgi:CRP/FNR family transcriptional regulator, cyclic AMP receptor protein
MSAHLSYSANSPWNTIVEGPEHRTVASYESPVIKDKMKPSSSLQAFLAKQDRGMTKSKCRKNQTVFSQGDLADAVFYIQQGKVKKTVVSERGKEVVLALLKTGDFFGERCLTGQPRRMATVTAMSESVIMRLDKACMLRMLREPAFCEKFISHLLARNIRIEDDLVDQLFNSSEKRLARLLLRLANFGKQTRPEPVVTDINQEMLAEMVGTTRSRVSYFMNKFRRAHFIDYGGHQIEVHRSLWKAVLHH